ncbi:MAG TPA: hypothetical protein VM597_09640 [Gemmataceae bacterium]|nr:hypothetical protein [Gemmataceae bacterium]
MIRLSVVFAASCLVLVGCEAPDPPQPEAPARLTPELAQEALVAMFRTEPVLMDGIRYDPEKVAAFPLRRDDDDSARCGPFGISLKGHHWNLTLGNEHAGYLFSGAFEYVGGRWTSRVTQAAHYHGRH